MTHLASLGPLWVDLALKSLVVLIAGSGLVLAGRRASAATRHWIWFLALTSLLWMPLLSAMLPGWNKPLWILSSHRAPGNELELSIELRPGAGGESPGESRGTLARLPSTAKNHVVREGPKVGAQIRTPSVALVMAIWLGGVLFVLSQVALSRARLGRIATKAKAFDDLQPLLATLASELNLSRPVALLLSTENLMPMTWGWWRPIILLPAEAQGWSEQRQRIVLLHELAHVKRWVCLTQFIGEIACALYWFNPLVWLAARRMCVERELACDDLVLSGGCKASDYATHLVEIARSFRRVPRVAAIAMARSSALQGRIGAIVDGSRARRGPRALLVSVYGTIALLLAATIAAQKLQTNANDSAESQALRQKQIARLQAFAVAKEKQSLALTAKEEGEISPIYRKFFDAAMKGDGQTVTNMYDDFKRRHPQYSNRNPDESLRTSYWSPVLEISMAYYDVMAGEPKYIQMAVDGIINSIPAGSVYFGGTDPGRALPAAFCKSHADADPFFTLTQNALADGTYLDYLRKMYGAKIYMLTKEDSDKCYEEYKTDARKRLDHDTNFPNEPRQIRPGEDVRPLDKTVRVTGQVAVMAVNARMAKLIFDKNSERAFYIEESFPLDWMYPYLEPHGLIMKINRQPVAEMSEDVIRKDHQYWRARVDEMIGPWLTEDTSVPTIAEFAEKVYARKDLQGFQGDARFVRNENMQKMFSKWRSAIGGLYFWHIQNTKSPAERERMRKEADFAFRQAFAISPSSPEALYRYVNILVQDGRLDDGIALGEAAQKVSPENKQLDQLLIELRRIKATPRK